MKAVTLIKKCPCWSWNIIYRKITLFYFELIKRWGERGWGDRMTLRKKNDTSSVCRKRKCNQPGLPLSFQCLSDPWPFSNLLCDPSSEVFCSSSNLSLGLITYEFFNPFSCQAHLGWHSLLSPWILLAISNSKWSSDHLRNSRLHIPLLKRLSMLTMFSVSNVNNFNLEIINI